MFFSMFFLCSATLKIKCSFIKYSLNCFVFWVITRYHERFEGCHLVEIFPTDLPELSKPKCSRNKSKKNKILEVKNLRSGITF